MVSVDAVVSHGRNEYARCDWLVLVLLLAVDGMKKKLESETKRADDMNRERDLLLKVGPNFTHFPDSHYLTEFDH